MKINLAANYDIELIEQLRPYPVKCIYGKFVFDAVGGGRPSYMGNPLSGKQLENYVKALKENGITFNYLLNSSCLGNMEWTKRGQRHIRSLLDSIAGLGIESVTVSTPYLFKLIKKGYPSFRVAVGIYAQVDTVKRVKFWESLGADAITLESFSINRNFPLLRKIRDATEVELILIANHVCLPNCAMQSYHQNCFAHASNSEHRFFIDHCFLQCDYDRMTDPSQYIKSSWIRPEDIGVYEAMGYHTFKLLERGMPSGELLKRVKAYAEGKFSGNLAEILLQYGFRGPIKKERFWALKYFFRPFQAPVSSMYETGKFLKEQGILNPIDTPPVSIDSAKIPVDFIKYFENMDCSNTVCEDCRYCDVIAAEAVSIERPEMIGKYKSILDKLETGEFWNV